MGNLKKALQRTKNFMLFIILLYSTSMILVLINEEKSTDVYLYIVCGTILFVLLSLFDLLYGYFKDLVDKEEKEKVERVRNKLTGRRTI